MTPSATPGGRRTGGRWRYHRQLPTTDKQFYPAKQIIKNLWIGSEGDSSSDAFFKKHDIRLVVNATSNIPFSTWPEVQTIRVPVDDHPDENETMLAHLPVVVLAIDDVLDHGHGVLVHCRAGMQRSAGVVAGYLMWKRGLTADQALEFINKKKPETFWPRATFDTALRAWEQALRRNGIVA